MTAKALLDQLRQMDESERVEAKRASKVGQSLLETVCAFANEPGLGGGWLLLGVEKASHTPGDYRVVGIDDPDGFLNDLHSRCANTFNIPLRIQARAERVEGKTVILVEVPEAEPACRPIHFHNKPLPRSAWRRSPNGDYRCNQDDLAALYQGRAGQSYDSSAVRGATLDDIDPDALDHYRQAREAMNPAAAELNFSNEELLESLVGAVRESGQLRPTVAGLLLFGRRVALRRLFPANRVDYIRVPGKEWIEDPEDRFTTLDMRDTLPRLIQRASAAVLDDLPRAFQLPEGQVQRDEKPVLPAKVVREAIVNAVMHRNYQRHQPIQLVRYSNRLEVSNPGYSLKAMEHLGEPGSEWRNPVIASVLHEMGLAETKGSGIRVMRRLMEDAGLSPPSFDSDRHRDQFSAIYLFHHFLSESDIEWLGRFRAFGLAEDEQRALIFVRETGRISNADYRDLNRVDTLTSSQRLTHLRDRGLLEQVPKGPATYYVPGNALTGQTARHLDGDLFGTLTETPEGLPQESRRLSQELKGLPQESRPLAQESSALSQEADPRQSLLEELPSALRQDIEKLGQRTRDAERLQRIIREICSYRPYLARELATLLGRRQDYLHRHYIAPLVEQGTLRYRYPDEPNRPDQAYISTKEDQ